MGDSMLSGSCWFMVTHSIQRADTREHVHILYFCLFKNYLIKKGQDTPLHCQRPMTYILWPMCFWDTEVRDVGVDARGQSGLSACTNWMKWFCDSWFIRLKVETWSQPHVSPHMPECRCMQNAVITSRHEPVKLVWGLSVAWTSKL